MSAKQTIVHVRGPSSLKLAIFDCSFDVCLASKPFSFINYAPDEHLKREMLNLASDRLYVNMQK